MVTQFSRRPRQPPSTPIGRRSLLIALPGASLSLGSSLNACRSSEPRALAVEPEASAGSPVGAVAASSSVLDVFPLGAPPWRTFDPFLFCVHHADAYPPGNAALGPAATLQGRDIGSDFAGKDGWRMYHGDVVPGFPRHPHRGFETITVTRRGFIDHSDSLGATARYGEGDVQWMTAGSGIVHSEMFPLLAPNRPNPTELLQIWINLPRENKFVAAHFSMFWQQSIPEKLIRDDSGATTKLRVVAGRFGDSSAPPPPPNSWASKQSADVAIWTLQMAPRATVTLPKASRGANRTLYFYRGSSLSLDMRPFTVSVGLRLLADRPLTLINGDSVSELLMLQGQPIAEPVVKRGPFVMNSEAEIRNAYADYRATQFGGWPWSGSSPVHAREKGRFALHADGRFERAPA